MPLPHGTSLGRYDIRSLLGVGGMGEVYLAQDKTLRRSAAIKILPVDFTTNRDRLHRFEREALAASSLNHPNILTIYEIGAENGTHFIATEYIDGESLRERIGPVRLDVREVLDIGIQVASALAAAHAAGIVHRDVKPENIMLRKDGIVKVLDFGLAKLVEQENSTPEAEAPTKALNNTAPGTLMGTAHYMSPEQARGLETDARTDTWSLGAVLYEMVAGRFPFEGETPSDVIASILKTEPLALTGYAPDAPAELERIVTKALRKDKEERYQVVKDLGLDLKSLKQRLEFEAELERTAAPQRDIMARAPATNDPSTIIDTARIAATQTGTSADVHGTSSAEYIATEIKRHKRGSLLVLAALLAATTALAYFAYTRYFSASGADAITSIAVLPFVNVSNDPNTEYLSEGISESLINSLSQLSGVKVIARSSSFKFKGKETDLQEVASALGVRAILTGRVIQRGDQLQISAELVDARDRTQMWGEQYNRKATDLLAVQSEISREIADRLRLKLTSKEKSQLAKSGTTSQEAYELALKGRFYFDKGGDENRKKAVEYYQQAIATDPNYALAYARLNFAYQTLINNSVLEPKEFLPRAEAAARKALELDENLAEAHQAFANIKRNAWDWEGAEREHERAIELNPNYAGARIAYAHYLSNMGRHEEAIAQIKRAKELDPLSTAVSNHVGYRLFWARRYDEAIEALKQTLELDKNYPLTYTVLGYAYDAKGMHREAIAAYQQSIKIGQEGPGVQIYLGAAYAKAGDPEEAQAILKRLESSGEYVSPAELAILYTALGQREQAIASLEKAYAARDVQLQYIGVDPGFDNLRGDPRFQDLVRRVGLPQQ